MKDKKLVNNLLVNKTLFSRLLSKPIACFHPPFSSREENTIFLHGSIVSVADERMWKLFKQISIIALKVPEAGIPSSPSKKMKLSDENRAERWSSARGG